MNNHREIFQKNNKNFMVFVGGLSDLSLYTPTLTVKRRTSDTSALLSKTGVVSDPSTTYVFYLTTTDTSLNPGDYVYDVTLESSTNRITLIKDILSILDAVKD